MISVREDEFVAANKTRKMAAMRSFSSIPGQFVSVGVLVPAKEGACEGSTLMVGLELG